MRWPREGMTEVPGGAFWKAMLLVAADELGGGCDVEDTGGQAPGTPFLSLKQRVVMVD